MRSIFVGLLACIVSVALVACAGDVSAPPPKSGADLLQALKAVADEGSLADARKTTRLLSLSVTAGTEHVSEPNCAQDGVGARDVSQSYKATSAWYRMQPGGIHQAVSKAFINPATTTGDRTISRYYIVTSTKVCKSDGPKTRIHAQLDMGGLPGFACVTPAMVIKGMHGRLSKATDGVSMATYVSNTGDAISKVQFFFRTGAVCALDVVVTQES